MLQTKKLLVEGRQIDCLHIGDMQQMSIQYQNREKNVEQSLN